MDPEQYCRQKVAVFGSSVYYALRQARADARPALTALYAWRRELDDVLCLVNDPSIAQAKLSWWRQEIQFFANGTETHPVMRSLAKTLPALRMQTARLLAILDAYLQDLHQARYLNEAALDCYLAGVGAACVSLNAAAEAAGTDIDFAAAETALGAWPRLLGSALLRTEIIAGVGDSARRGRIYLPISEMQRFGVPVVDLIQRRYSSAFTEMMQSMATQARLQLHQGLASIPLKMQKRQRALRAQAALALALLDELAAENFQVLHQRISLTPLRKLWVTWRGTRG